MTTSPSAAETEAAPGPTSVPAASAAPYPPAPWHLRGSAVVALFPVPVADLPPAVAAAVPAGARPLRVAGRVPVLIAVARYVPGGDLSYHEALVAVPTARLGMRAMRAPAAQPGSRDARVPTARSDGRPATAGPAGRRRSPLTATVAQIWVDSAASRTGGRKLWAIPKELGTFVTSRGLAGLGTTLTVDGTPVLTVQARLGRRLLPGAPAVPLTTLQRGTTPAQGGGAGQVRARVRVRAVTHPVRARWAFAPAGPLGYLAGRSPLAVVGLTDAALVVGGD
ncbi:acetoacetate decarboxylase family protein [Georgenia sp. TF02-10]|uniref:acetoacetate decarboxylase family protein n=1 Tax=Georgenia sp. TF02-10 TaxID=2917725 RepID=UPI001FA79FD9|nr:acetoacetate decarboxylase family protein [Georgenia sp. TF02-10]UNX54126.1 acetoacetate decarboxylase family protein [Georgenia sp. TF02-10]